MALMNLSQTSSVREMVEEIDTAAKRAAELCRQMLAYSGKGRFVVRAIGINEIVEEMAHLLEVSVSKKAILNYNFADNLPPIEVDVTQIRQIIMNLITNASEAIGDRTGTISVSTGAMQCDREYLGETYLDDALPEGNYVYIEVSDSGCGMDEETLGKIFDPFFTTKFTGRGLGLAAVLGIVRGHKGAISIYSEPDKGTMFRILLPASDKPIDLFEPKDSDFQYWRGGGTVLLVDDEESVRSIGKRMLHTMGFDVLTAENGIEAIELFREHESKIRFVILDLTMPHMSGDEAFSAFQKIKSDVVVILSSGYDRKDVLDRFAEKGVAGFIQKPYEYDTMVKRISRALSSREKERDA